MCENPLSSEPSLPPPPRPVLNPGIGEQRSRKLALGKASVNPSGSLAFQPVGDYNGRHACWAFADFLA
jgi:hypothetical protein